MGSFVFGMIAGLLYCKHKQGHIDLTKSKVCQQFLTFPIRIDDISIYISFFSRLAFAHTLVQFITDRIFGFILWWNFLLK